MNRTSNCRNKVNCPFNGECLLRVCIRQNLKIMYTLVLRELLSKQYGNNTSTVCLTKFKQQPWLNLLHQKTSNSPKLNDKYYLKLTAQYGERQIIDPSAI